MEKHRKNTPAPEGNTQGTKSDNKTGRENVHALPFGTVLDGRYEVRRLIRQGGFGITYEAVHINSDKTVAVKEYFCREICARKSGQIVVADPASLPRFKEDRARFLREMRILREFAGEPSVVRAHVPIAFLLFAHDGKRLKTSQSRTGPRRRENTGTQRKNEVCFGVPQTRGIPEAVSCQSGFWDWRFGMRGEEVKNRERHEDLLKKQFFTICGK